MKRNLKSYPHGWIVLVLFLLLAILQKLLASVAYTNEHSGRMFFPAMLVVYGLYLVFIVIFYLVESYLQWVNHQDWIVGLLKGYGSLFLFCLLFSFLIPGSSANFPLELFQNWSGFSRAITILSMQFFSAGFCLAFPVGLYGLYLSIKSLLAAPQKYQTFMYGVILFLLSLILLWRSHAVFRLILSSLFMNG